MDMGLNAISHRILVRDRVKSDGSFEHHNFTPGLISQQVLIVLIPRFGQ